MNNIINNEYIKAFYNKEISSLELADIYYENKLYSAASSLYNISLDSILNSNKFEEKSYCFSQMSMCYLMQQKDKDYSEWQLSMIYDMAYDAIVFNTYNYIAWYCLGKANELFNKTKEAYYAYSYILMNLLDYVKEEDEELIYDIIFNTINIAEQKYIIKYDYFFKKIINWYVNTKNYDFNKYYNLINKIYEHKNMLSEDEKNIMYNII